MNFVDSVGPADSGEIGQVTADADDCSEAPTGPDGHIEVVENPEPFLLGDPGRSYWEVGGGIPFISEVPPDTQCDQYDFRGVAIRAASVRGLSHRNQSEVRQDHYTIVYDDVKGLVAGAVADGVGSKSHSHIAAQVACRTSTKSLLANGGVVDLVSAFSDASREVESARSGSGLDMATTLLAFAMEFGEDSDQSLTLSLASVGDTAAWRFSRLDGFTRVSGGKKNSNATVSSTKTRALDYHSVEGLEVLELELRSGDAIFFCSDGVGDLLDSAHRELGKYFADVWRETPTALNFAAHVGFGLKSFDDDRTGVLIRNCR